jgi:hypothetical protein
MGASLAERSMPAGAGSVVRVEERVRREESFITKDER